MSGQLWRRSQSFGPLILLAFACGCCFIVAGCGREAQPPRGTATPSSTTADASTEVPYPQYANWSQFEVGTRVVRRKQVTNPHGVVIETETLTLREKNASRVVVESQTLVERTDGRLENNPPQTWEFPATFRLPASITLEQIELPSLSAKMIGTERVLVADTGYEARVYQWTEVNEAGPMSVRLLSAPDFPGHKLRQEMFTEQTQTKSIETIVEVEIVRS